MEAHFSELYAVAYFSAIVVLASLEPLMPRRGLMASASLGTRWVGNIGVTVVGTLLLRSVLPVTGIAVAYLMAERGWGLLNLVTLPTGLSVVVAVLLLDLTRYLNHLLMHKIPLLWRIHRLHHTDQDVDFTTQLRAHPLEIVFNAGVGLLVILLLGPPVLALVLFSMLFAAQAFWTHSNVVCPAGLDRWLRLVFTTPDVHRIHHSVDLRESNSNLGAMLTWWDRLFGTFVEQPALGHGGMVLGVSEFRDPKHMSLPWMLANPFLQPDPVDAVEGAGFEPDTTVAS